MSIDKSNINPKELLNIEGRVWVYWKNQQGSYLACNDLMAFSLELISCHDIVGRTDFDFPLLKREAEFYRHADNPVIKSKIAMQFTETATLPKTTIQFSTLKTPIIYKSNKIELFGMSYYLNKNNPTSLVLLTKREQQILQLLISGKTAKEIGLWLSRSKRTIEHHIDNIKNKWGVTTKYELIRKAMGL